jgi:O-antigen/teichoic acid export membrane protein
MSKSDFLGSYRRGHGRYDLSTIESLVPALGSLLPAIIIVYMGVSFDTFQLVIGSAASILVAIRALIAIKGELRQVDDLQGETSNISYRKLIGSSCWFLLLGILSWVNIELPVFMLRLLADTHAVGLFASAFRPVGLVTQMFTVIIFVFMPSLSRDYMVDSARFAMESNRFNLVMLCLAPVGLSLAVLGGGLMISAFGDAYREAQSILIILAVGQTVHFSVLSSLTIAAIRKEKAIVWLMSASIGVNLILCYLLIPGLRELGAALASLVSLVLIKIAYLWTYVRFRLPLGKKKHLAAIVFLSAWVIAVSIAPTTTRNILLVAGFLVGGVFSFLILKETKLFT